MNSGAFVAIRSVNTRKVNMAMDAQRLGPPKSDIGVANHDLDTAIAVTQQFRDAGLERPTVAEASEALAKRGEGQAATYKNKIYAVAKYQLIALVPNRETRLNEVVLLPLGSDILDPQRARTAKVRAFLNVELNRTLYARYQYRLLPKGLELDEVLSADLGVVEKQRQHVRRTFIRSASSAGFFEQGHDYLALPSDVPWPADIPLPEVPEQPDPSQNNMEDGMEQPADVGPSVVTERTNGVASAPPTPAPEAQQTRTVPATASPTSRPILKPEIIDYWRESEPRPDASKAKWKKWLNWLNDALDLRGDDEDHRA